MPQVVRMQNPKALEVEGVEKLFKAAFDESPMVHGGYEVAKPAFVKLTTEPTAGIFVGVEEGEFRGLAIVSLPTDKYNPIPNVPRFYAEGSKALKSALIKAVVDFVVENGYTKFWAVNVTGKPDEVWERAFKEAGAMRPVGSIMEIEVG